MSRWRRAGLAPARHLANHGAKSLLPENIASIVCGILSAGDTRKVAEKEGEIDLVGAEQVALSIWLRAEFLRGTFLIAVHWNRLRLGFEVPRRKANCAYPALPRSRRAMVMSWKLRPGVELKEVTLETLSQDVVIGLMGLKPDEGERLTLGHYLAWPAGYQT